MGGQGECSTTCCCWTWRTEPASAGGALWWPAAFSTHAAHRKWELDHSKRTWYNKAKMSCDQPLTCCAPLSLLSVRSSSECVAQTSCSAARSLDRSVLKCSVVSGRSGTFYKHNRHLAEEYDSSDNQKDNQPFTHPQFIKKHDHPVFVVFDEGVHTLHIGLLFEERFITYTRTNTNFSQGWSLSE